MRIRLGLGLSHLARLGPAFARPSAPAFTLAQGEADGEVDITITDLGGWGDDDEVGDGEGAAGVLQWWNVVDGWQELTDDPDETTYTVELDETLWGQEITIRVRKVSATPRTGSLGSGTVTVPGEPPVLSTLLGFDDDAPLLGFEDDAPLEYEDG